MITFVRTRTEYATYVDYWKLVELSGFPTCYIDEIPPEGVKENVYIITPFNGEWSNGVVTDARVVGWDLEYRREPQPPIPGVKEVWHMDAAQAALIGAKYVPIGGHAGLNDGNPVPYEVYPIDVAYLGYMTHRRQVVYRDLLQRFVKLSPTSAWGDDRNAILNASRVYLHVHQHDDIPAVPGLRLVVAAAYKLPVIMEACADVGAFQMRGPTYQFRYDEIADTTPQILKINDLKGYGEALHNFLCHELTFRKSVESAL